MTTIAFKKADASDYITAKRQMAIADEYVHATNTAPEKTNGFKYARNFKFISAAPTQQTVNNCLIRAQSFELKQNYTSGVNYLNTKCPT